MSSTLTVGTGVHYPQSHWEPKRWKWTQRERGNETTNFCRQDIQIYSVGEKIEINQGLIKVSFLVAVFRGPNV